MKELNEVQRLLAALEPRGVYLYGSAVHGGLRPDSDLDVFVVAGRRLTADEQQRVRAIEGRTVDVVTSADDELALVVHRVLSASRTLAGPPPQALLEPPSPDALRAALFARVEPALTTLHADPTNTLLELCRIYCALVTGAVVPKAEAAAWAHARFPHDALRRAQLTYVGGLPERYEGIDLDYVAANLRALIAQQDRA
jgi:predicted nucleotidyltransferase